MSRDLRQKLNRLLDNLRQEELDERIRLRRELALHRQQDIELFKDINLARERAGNIRKKVVNNLDHFLVEFENHFSRNGGEVHWVKKQESLRAYLSAAIPHGYEPIVQPGPLADECQLNELCQQILRSRSLPKQGEYGKCHIVLPDFGLCDIGGVAELNPLPQASDSTPNKLVYILGLEQLLPSVSDLYLFAPLKSVYDRNAYLEENMRISLPDRKGEVSYELLLIDNGRSELLRHPEGRELLAATDTKALAPFDCLFPFLSDEEEELSGGILSRMKKWNTGSERGQDAEVYLSTLDGFSEQNANLNLPIREILIRQREKFAERTKSETDLTWRTWKNAMLNRKFLNKSSIGPLSLMRSFFKRGYNGARQLPKMAKNSFNEEWVKTRPEIQESRKLTDIPKGELLVRKPARPSDEDQ